MPLQAEFVILTHQCHELQTFILLILHNPKEKTNKLRVSHQEIEGAMGMSSQHWWDTGQFSQMIQSLLNIAQSKYPKGGSSQPSFLYIFYTKNFLDLVSHPSTLNALGGPLQLVVVLYYFFFQGFIYFCLWISNSYHHAYLWT